MVNADSQGGTGSARGRRLGRFARRAGLVLLILVVVGGGGMAGMEYYTGQPRFCGSCHIMQPYYVSWEQDVHATKVGAACIDCHYAPGERHTLHAKMAGLSQVVTYFSGRAGGRRPRPQVSDESCLREGCHTIPEIANKECLVRDVKFVHAKHLEPDSAAVQENTAELGKLQGQLRQGLGDAMFQRLEQLAVQLDDPNRLEERVLVLLQPVGQSGIVAASVEYIQRLRRDIRYRQVADNLRCTTCHAFNEDRQHFSVRTNVCNTCHFVGQPFNTDTGRCLNCHNPPQIEVPVHAKSVSEAVGPAVRAGTMDHSLIIEKNVDCRSCHSDLVRGTGRVSRERCASCHDLARYFTQFEQNPSPDTVTMLHEKHVADLFASCTDCHEPIQHRLEPKDAMAVAAGFLEPVRENCAHCHPNHHRAQVEMLVGQPPAPIHPGGANAMFGSRVSCLGCHTQATTDPKGMTVVEATRQACVICHSEDYESLFEQWVTRLQIREKEVGRLQQHVDRVVAGRGGVEQLPAEARQVLERARATVEFVVAARGIHNRNYALTLLDNAEMDLEQALRLMGEPVPPPAPAPASAPTACIVGEW